MSTGRLYGVGLGPGDPELVTVKAARLIARRRRGRVPLRPARPLASPAAIAAPHLRGDQIEEPLVYPVTTETIDHPGGYQGAIDEFYAEAAAAAGRPPRRRPRRRRCSPRATRSSTAPTCTCTSASRTASAPRSSPASRRSAPRPPRSASRWWSATRCSPCCPARCRRAELARRLADTDSAAIMKLGRTFDDRPRRGRRRRPPTGVLRRAGHDGRPAHRRRSPTSTPTSVPYFAIALLPGAVAASLARTAAARAPARARSSSSGTGPAGRDWPTPQVAAALSAADDLVGYGPYLDRVPPNPRPDAGTPATTASRPNAPRTRSTWPRPAPRRGRVGRRPGRVRDGRGGAGGRGRAEVRRRPRARAARADRRERRGRGGRRAARATTTP